MKIGFKFSNKYLVTIDTKNNLMRIDSLKVLSCESFCFKSWLGNSSLSKTVNSPKAKHHLRSHLTSCIVCVVKWLHVYESKTRRFSGDSRSYAAGDPFVGRGSVDVGGGDRVKF